MKSDELNGIIEKTMIFAQSVSRCPISSTITATLQTDEGIVETNLEEIASLIYHLWKAFKPQLEQDGWDGND